MADGKPAGWEVGTSLGRVALVEYSVPLRQRKCSIEQGGQVGEKRFCRLDVPLPRTPYVGIGVVESKATLCGR